MEDKGEGRKEGSADGQCFTKKVKRSYRGIHGRPPEHLGDQNPFCSYNDAGQRGRRRERDKRQNFGKRGRGWFPLVLIPLPLGGLSSTASIASSKQLERKMVKTWRCKNGSAAVYSVVRQTGSERETHREVFPVFKLNKEDINTTPNISP